MVYKHADLAKAVNQKMIDMLISQVQTTPLPRARESAIMHLYDAGVSLKAIADAYDRDLRAGDAILNQMPNEQQNAAPETQQWLGWLKVYEDIHRQLRRIEDAINGAPPELEAA